MTTIRFVVILPVEANPDNLELAQIGAAMVATSIEAEVAAAAMGAKMDTADAAAAAMGATMNAADEAAPMNKAISNFIFAHFSI